MKELTNGAKKDLIQSGRRGPSFLSFVIALFTGMFYFHVY